MIERKSLRDYAADCCPMAQNRLAKTTENVRPCSHPIGTKPGNPVHCHTTNLYTKQSLDICWFLIDGSGKDSHSAD